MSVSYFELFLIRIQLFSRKPRTKRGKRILLKKEPKIVENTKHCVFIPGRKSSLEVSSCMKDLVSYIIIKLDLNFT